MANIATMLALLGQQAQAGVQAPPEAVGDTIQVAGQRTPLPAYEPPTYRMDPAQEVPQYQNIQQAPPDTTPFPRTEASPQEVARQNPMSNLAEHKGLFGVKGTLRDVLGTLGDALLVGGGGQAIYRPQKEKEKVSDALVGYGQGDDNQDNAVLARLAQANPEEFQKMLALHQAGQYKQQMADAAKARVTSQDTRAANAQRIQKAKMMPNLLAAAASNPDQQAALKAWYQDPSSSIQDLDPETLAAAAITQYQQAQLKQGDRRLDMTDEHYDRSDAASAVRAQAAMINAKKPRGGSTPNPTDTSLAAPLLAKIRNGQSLTNGEKEVLQRLGKGSNRGGGGQSVRDRLGAPPAAAASPPVGYKNKNGLTFRGGDPNDRKNWK
jgi:hypothetical protein